MPRDSVLGGGHQRTTSQVMVISPQLVVHSPYLSAMISSLALRSFPLSATISQSAVCCSLLLRGVRHSSLLRFIGIRRVDLWPPVSLYPPDLFPSRSLCASVVCDQISRFLAGARDHAIGLFPLVLGGSVWHQIRTSPESGL